MEFKMKKIALALVVQSLFISNLALAEIGNDGYQTVSDIKIKYPKEFVYSKELTSQLKSGLEAEFSNSDISLKSVSGYMAEPVCGLTTVMLNEMVLSDKPAATAEQMAQGSVDAVMSLPNVKVISSSVKKLDIDGLDSARSYTILNDRGTFVYSDGFQLISPNDNKTMQVAFVGFTEKENEVKEMQKCVDEFVSTVELAK